MKVALLSPLLSATALLASSPDAKASDPEGAGGSTPRAEGSAFDHDHSRWTALLEELVHDGGLVDYGGIRRRREDLRAYVRGLESVRADEYRGWSAQEKEAFWINAYNAYTVRLVLEHHPVDSIRDIGGLFSSVFDKRFIPLQHLARTEEEADVHGKKDLSLNEVEHGVLAGISRRPLFHFAINCASASCPVLLDRAYVPDTLDGTLREQARTFLADPEKNDQRIRDDEIELSRIFDWSEDELEEYPGGIVGLLRDLAPESVASDPALEGVDIGYRDYDWSLNEWRPRHAK